MLGMVFVRGVHCTNLTTTVRVAYYQPEIHFGSLHIWLLVLAAI